MQTMKTDKREIRTHADIWRKPYPLGKEWTANRIRPPFCNPADAGDWLVRRELGPAGRAHFVVVFRYVVTRTQNTLAFFDDDDEGEIKAKTAALEYSYLGVRANE